MFGEEALSCPSGSRQIWGRLWRTLVIVFLVTGCTESATSIRHQAYFQDPELLTAAWQLPVAQKYRPSFQYQSNWAFCGPATVNDTLGSLGLPTASQSDVLDKGGLSLWRVLVMGMTLDEVASTIENQDPRIRTQVLRGLTFEQFMQYLKQTNDPAYRYIINFTREPLFGVKIGHHSPIGGYLTDKNLVFVLDVNDHYKPFLVPPALLYKAMNTVDSSSDKLRGMLQVTWDHNAN